MTTRGICRRLSPVYPSRQPMVQRKMNSRELRRWPSGTWVTEAYRPRCGCFHWATWWIATLRPAIFSLAVPSGAGWRILQAPFSPTGRTGFRLEVWSRSDLSMIQSRGGIPIRQCFESPMGQISSPMVWSLVVGNLLVQLRRYKGTRRSASVRNDERMQRDDNQIRQTKTNPWNANPQICGESTAMSDVPRFVRVASRLLDKMVLYIAGGCTRRRGSP
jgi:hypothetical protein